MGVKETNSEKIKRIYTISEVNKLYKEIVEKHRNKEITDAELIFGYDKIYAENWRGGFISLENWKNEEQKLR